MDFMNAVIDDVPNVSVITKIEVLGFNAPLEHYQLLSNFINDATVVNLTDEIVDLTINIRKKHRTKLPDAIIAATAMGHNLILITRNISDFKDIEGLELIDAHSR
jgi:predicted nucleic acid-binding protein